MSTAADLRAEEREPLGVASGTLGMVLFLATEAMFFAGLISAFLVLKSQAVAWPPAGQPRLPVFVTGINTGILVLSVYPMALAVRAREPGTMSRLLGSAATLGGMFVLIQGYEWVRLVGFGLGMTATNYGATFYTLIGAHGLHVMAALVTLAVVAGRVRRVPPGRAARSVGLLSLYWYFVVAVWPVLYLLVYQPWRA